MSVGAGRDRGRSVWRLLVAGVGCALFALYAWLATRNPHVGFLADDALYLLMADIYSPYRDAIGAVYEHVRLYSQLPPFYPLLLALAGGGVDALLPARILTAGCMALAWAACLGWLRARGVPRAGALAMTLYFALLPATLLHTVDLWSEGLYLLLVSIALQAEQRLGRGRAMLAAVALGVLLACVMETRSIGLALAGAVLMGVWRRSWRAALLCTAALAVGVFALSSLDLGKATNAYGGLLVRHYAADPQAAFARQWSAVSAALPAALTYDFIALRAVTAWQWLPIGVLLAASLRGFWVECRAGSVLALYLLGYVAITLIWPFPDHIERFLFPLLPCAGFLAWRGLVWRGDGRIAAVLVPALATLLAAPAIVGTLTRMTNPVSVPAFDSFRTTRYWLDATRGGDPVATIAALDAHQRAARGLRDTVPRDACVYTYDLSLALVLGRHPAFLPPPAARMARGPRWGCDWFLLVANPVQGNPPLYPLDHLRAHAQAVTITRLRDDDPAAPIVAVLMRVRDTLQP